MIPQTIAPAWRRVYSAINYRLRDFAGGRFASLCRPVSIGLLITERCNARCIHCDIWKNRGQEDSPSPDDWKRVLSGLAEWLGPVHVVLTGGEALLRPWTPELIAHGSRLGLFIETLTHGYWMDQSRIEQMALARPSRITISLDGLGATHSLVRGREKFWLHTEATLANLIRLRTQHRLGYSVRLKTVLMEQTLDDAPRVADFAAERGMEVFYQPIEQNYNTPEDARWFEHAPTWPRDTERAAACVGELIRLKQAGRPIRNSSRQLQAMIDYFRDPDSMRVRVQSHAGHERLPLCGALTTMQIQSNGDVMSCVSAPAAGNIKRDGIREIWARRPQWWKAGCCLERRFSVAEKERALVSLTPGGKGA